MIVNIYVIQIVATFARCKNMYLHIGLSQTLRVCGVERECIRP